jgi:hypothetical protein
MCGRGSLVKSISGEICRIITTCVCSVHFIVWFRMIPQAVVKSRIRRSRLHRRVAPEAATRPLLGADLHRGPGHHAGTHAAAGASIFHAGSGGSRA